MQHISSQDIETRGHQSYNSWIIGPVINVTKFQSFDQCSDIQISIEETKDYLQNI